ncbi:MAG: hypothetical protein JO257_15545 [Deltaproteobacteria bacterium]|nr:hypothetical protein [Deltaproteobacteria bacterium]
MTRTRGGAFAILFVVAACGTNGQNGNGGDGSGPPYSGSGGTGGTGSDGGDDGANVDPTYPTQHPRIYIAANQARLQAALTAHSPAAVRFQQVVDNYVNGADLWGFRAWNAALLGQLTGAPKYCTKAVSVVDQQVSAAESAIAAGQQPVVANDSYLDVGDDIGDVALVYDWCFDSLTASQRTRWLAYANQAVWNVWHPTAAKWGSHTMPWSGWATDDPSDNYYYSFLRATMLLGLAEKGEDPAGDTWIAQFRQTKVLGELVPTFDADLQGGGSREGTGYGVAMRNLWSIYDFWKSTTGEKLASKTGHTRASLRSMIHQIVPTLDRFAPTGDQSRDSTASMFDYQRNYLQALVTLYPTDAAAGPAQTLLAQCSVAAMGQSFMAVDDFLYENRDVAQAPLTSLGTSYYAPGIGEVYARSGWDAHATWINMIAGAYTQSHAHQDQGSLMIYKDGWLAYDAVVDSHSGLTQATTAHSLVRIDNGGSPIPQVASTESKLLGLHAGSAWLYAAADLTPAYNGSSKIQKVNREIVYLQPNAIVVYDRVQSSSGTSQVWQLATPRQPSISGSTATISNAGHALAVQRLQGGAYSVHNMTSESDYGGGYRLDETSAGGNNRLIHVLSIDGAVTSASAAGDTVVVHLSGGQTATIAFNHDAAGATMAYLGTNVDLSATVDTLAP